MKIIDAKYKKFTTKLQTQENKNQHTEKQSIMDNKSEADSGEMEWAWCQARIVLSNCDLRMRIDYSLSSKTCEFLCLQIIHIKHKGTALHTGSKSLTVRPVQRYNSS